MINICSHMNTPPVSGTALAAGLNPDGTWLGLPAAGEQTWPADSVLHAVQSAKQFGLPRSISMATPTPTAAGSLSHTCRPSRALPFSVPLPRAKARGYNLSSLRDYVIRASLLIFLIAVLYVPATAQTVDAPKLSPFQKDEVDTAVDKAIVYLTRQQKDSGAIHDRSHDTTMTSLAIMAMAGVGIQPADPGPQGQAMNRALNFVLKDDRQDDKGYYGGKDGSRMYGHGITALMLTEMLGMGASEEQDRQIHEKCQKAIDLILSAQKEKKSVNHQGGWRYYPNSKDADLSASVWQLMALRSAKNDGLQVPASAIQDAVEYLKRSYSAPLDRDGLPLDDKPGGFSYEPGRRHASFTMTAAGLLAMQVCGEYESPLVKGAADYLLTKQPNWKERFCLYGTYYYSQGMYQRGGEHANTARKIVQEMLLSKQHGDGSWEADRGEEKNVGRVYATSMAVLSLSVKYHYLPIYQK